MDYFPSGGLPYFLVHQVGYNKAMELLLRDKISAQEALNLGLINMHSCTLRRTKQLASITRNTLKEYYKQEEGFLNF